MFLKLLKQMLFLLTNFNYFDCLQIFEINCSLNSWCQCLGGYNSWGTPVPIPNTEVKTTCADGSASNRCVRVGSCQDFDIKNNTRESWKLWA